MLFVLYTPVAAVGYFSLGSCVSDNVLLSLSDGPVKTAAEIVVLVHLVTAVPIIINPPNQFVEGALRIPKGMFYSFAIV